jgi:hypothetical protein
MIVMFQLLSCFMSVWLHCVLIKFAAFALKLISDYETRSLASHNIQSTSEYYLNVHSSLRNRQSKIIVEVCEGIIVVQLFCFYDWSSSCSIESSVHWPEKERERDRKKMPAAAIARKRPCRFAYKIPARSCGSLPTSGPAGQFICRW